MNPRPSVGIVTRTKDRCVLLRRAIESILNQSYDNWQMVIVNDGGVPSDVEELVGHYAGTAAGRIRILHNAKSMGMEGASKVGIETIDTDLIIFHDDDDSWAPEFLNITVHELLRMQRKFPLTQGVTTYSHVVHETVRGNLVEIDAVIPFNDWVPRGFLSLDRMLAGNFLPPISFLFSRKAYEDVGHIYEVIPYLGDWDFLTRFLSKYDVYMVPQFLAFYHWRVGSGAGVFGNSVTAEVDQHHFYRQYLLNSWLRADFASGKFGRGSYANLRMELHKLEAEREPRTAAPVEVPAAPQGDRVPPGMPHEMLDYYWESASWTALKPVRAIANAILGLPPEERPLTGGIEDSWRIAREVQESFTWNAMAPLRMLQAALRFVGARFGRK